MLNLSDIYQWQLEDAFGTVRTQHNDDGSENQGILWGTEIVRASFLPRIEGRQRHDCLIDINRGEKFARRFGRGFMKMIEGRYQLFEYLHCAETNRYRFWLFSTTGQTLVTRPDYEVNV